MANILSTLSTVDWAAFYAALVTLYSIISTGVAALQTKLKNLVTKQSAEDLKNASDVMDPRKETTDEQRQLLKDGKLSAGTWKMNAATRRELYDLLTEAGADVNPDALEWAINKAEEDCNPEYVIRCFSYTKGKALEEEPAAFISYGTILKVAEWAKIKAIAAEHHENDFYSIS